MTLKELAIGKTAVIRSVGGEGALRQHFLDMGLIPGAEVTLVKLAPMGDPMELRIHGYELTLRLDDAAQIGIIPTEKVPAAPALVDDKMVDHPGLGEGGKYHIKKGEHPLPDGTTLTFALAGNQNCGKTTLFNQLTGSNQHVGNFPGVTVDRKDGVIKLDGKEVRNRNARESIKNGFALLTEERRATGIFGILNIRENTVISSLKKHKKAGFYLSDKSMEKDTAWAIDAMHIKTPSQKTKIRSLSGGNQQKVILGRWLLTEPEVLMLDEPTRGIDVGAKYEIYQLIIDLANKGKVVLMVSSEMPELLGVCDRILVMSGGKLAGEVDAKNTTQEEIMSLAAKYV